MKKRVYILILTVLCGILILTATACTGAPQESTSRQEKVVRGDLSVTVSGSGYIEIGEEAKLAFATGGRIKEILVEEGDVVTKGMVLARLETDDLEMSVKQAESGVNQAELAVSQAEYSLRQAEAAVTPAKVAVTQAEVAVEAAKFELERMKDYQDIKDKIDEADREIEIAQTNLNLATQAEPDRVYILNWGQQIASAQEKKLLYQKELADLLDTDEFTSFIPTEVEVKSLQLQAAEQTVVQATEALSQTQVNIKQAKVSINYANKSLEYAKYAYEYAKKQLEKTTLVATLDGMVESVSANEGDTVPPPSVMSMPVVHIIDTSDLELKVDVDEIDLPLISTGQKTVVSIDALPDLVMEGDLSYISPLSNPQAGVVLYRTTVHFAPPAGVSLRAGMSATADIILNKSENTLIIPERAVYTGENGRSMVKVIVNDTAEEREVETGITDGFDIEIISGLAEGEIVEVHTKSQSSESISFFG